MDYRRWGVPQEIIVAALLDSVPDLEPKYEAQAKSKGNRVT